MKIRDIILIVLVIGMLISTATLVIFAATGINDIKSITSESSSDELVAIATKKISTVASGVRNLLDNALQNQFNQVGLWARDPLFQETAVSAGDYTMVELQNMWASQSIGIALNPALTAYLTDTVENTSLTSLLVTDSRGYLIAASGTTHEFDFSSKEWYTDSVDPANLMTKDTLVSGLYRGPVYWNMPAQQWNIDLAKHIKNPETGEIAGVVKATVDYSSFMNDFMAVASVDSYEVKIIKDDGLVLATTFEDKTKVNNEDFNILDYQYYQDAISRSSKLSDVVPASSLDENGESVYATTTASRYYPDNIVVVSELALRIDKPIDSFISSLQSNINGKAVTVRNNMIIIGVAVAVVLIIAAFFIIRAKITMPLQKLTAVSNKLSQGEIEGLSIDVKGKDEISAFGESFQGVLAAFNFLKDEVEKKS